MLIIDKSYEAVGLANQEYSVLVLWTRNETDLRKAAMFQIDDSRGMFVPRLGNFLLAEMINSRSTTPKETPSISNQNLDMNCAECIIMGSWDDLGTGFHVHFTSESSSQSRHVLLGADNNSMQTYMQRNPPENFEYLDLEPLVVYCMKSLTEGPSNARLTIDNTYVFVVGRSHKFTAYDKKDVARCFEKLDSTKMASNS